MRTVGMFGFLFLLVLVVGSSQAISQSQCNCSSEGVCSASQSCPSGYLAVCTCTTASCGSSCQKAGSDEILPEAANQNRLVKSLNSVSAKEIGSLLSKAFRRPIDFVPTDSNFRFNIEASKSRKGSHWDTFEYLAHNGELSIDGLGMEYWRTTRGSLLKGDNFTICTGGAPVSFILRHLSFISGTKLSIVSGDPNTVITRPLKGNGLADLISKLSEMGSVSIVEN